MKRIGIAIVLPVLLLCAGVACKRGAETPAGPMAPEAYEDEPGKWRAMRQKMVTTQIEGRDVSDAKVLAAMRKTPRHLFVPERYRHESYEDYPLPIEEAQTISQPYIVAKMTELLGLKGGESVLEIGTGSGYQAAVLAEIAAEVYTIEIIPELGQTAQKRLEEMGYTNIHVMVGDGYKGWPEHAPFDAIIVTAAPPYVPPALVEQLKVGGRLVLPVGVSFQELIIVTRNKAGYETQKVFPVRFVPMTGEVQEKSPENP